MYNLPTIKHAYFNYTVQCILTSIQSCNHIKCALYLCAVDPLSHASTLVTPLPAFSHILPVELAHINGLMQYVVLYQ